MKNKYSLLSQLIEGQLSGELNESQFRLLQQMMLNDPESLVYYIEYTTLWALLDEAGGFQDIGFATEFDSAMMDAFAEEERTAPPIEIPAVSKKSQEDEKPTEIKKVHPKVSKFSIVSLAMSSAALLFVIVYAHFVSMRRGIETATLTDSMNAKWADIASPVEKGTRLVTGEKRWLLREGYAELLFDNQARVVLEGPAEFQILAEDRVGLSYGKVYARVPQTAGGFSVYTPNAKIIDLGTEFGVQVEIGGNTQLHVLKGKTMLMAGKTDRVNMEVSQRNARKISGENGKISNIRCQSDHFVRVINSESRCVWRGQNLDLADIVGGGNGLGTGKRGSCIDTTTGEWKPESYLPSSSEDFKPGTHMKSNYCFHAVKDNPFIDGVFIPDNGQGPVVISTQGHSFEGFPDTSELGWGGIVYVEESILKHPIKLNNVQYGVPERSALFMHGNAGITFDLEQIRQAFPGSLREFRAVYGIADDYWDGVGCPAYADFWVLVDGQVRFSRKGVQVHQGGTISVVLSDQDRFLTLVTTDGGKGSPEYDNRTSFNDWSVFGEPCLIFD